VTTPNQAEDTPRLERWGIRMLTGTQLHAAVSADLDVHVLDEEEQRALFRIEWAAVGRATLAGALSALASGITEVVAGKHFSLDRAPTMHDLVQYWGVYLIVTIVASVAEIVYLYVDTLLAVRALAASAGLPLHGSAASRDVAAALARAALELPDPDRPVLGVNPRRESSRIRLLVASLAYKLKIGVSSFVFKALVRRALGRLATRQLLAFAAVPVNALWNGIVTYRVLREARIRAMGPSAVEALLPLLVPETGLSLEARRSIVRAVAASIVRSEAAHPNLVYLLRRVLDAVGPFETDLVIDDPGLFLADLAALPEAERTSVRKTLALASILDGRLAKNERRLLLDAGADVEAVKALRHDFVRGRRLAIDTIV
jgi:hypothetical protein